MARFYIIEIKFEDECSKYIHINSTVLSVFICENIYLTWRISIETPNKEF